MPTPDLTPERMRSVREAAGLTQDALADLIREQHAKMYRKVPGVKPLRTTCIQVSRWEAGVRTPTGTGAEALARVLGRLEAGH